MLPALLGKAGLVDAFVYAGLQQSHWSALVMVKNTRNTYITKTTNTVKTIIHS
jgi:hypothetical protein